MFSVSTLSAVAVTIVAAGIVPTVISAGDLDSSALPYPVAVFTTVVADNLAFLVLPVVACLPYVLGFMGLVQHRFLTYARVRASSRLMVTGHVGACGLVTGVTLAMVGALPGIPMVFGGYTLAPEEYLLLTPESIRAAELSDSTFTQFVSGGEWAVPVAYGLWVGINAALYAVISLCLTILQRSRVVALVAPWAVQMVVGYGMALVGLEGFSPSLIMPFNVTQLPLSNLA
ncbi:MAG: hypothetical protein ACK5LS_04350 [Propioniciclava sp.]